MYVVWEEEWLSVAKAAGVEMALGENSVQLRSRGEELFGMN